jgi:hypothetical protein
VNARISPSKTTGGLDSCDSLIGLDDEQVMEAIGVQHVQLNGDSPTNAYVHGRRYMWWPAC